MALCLCALVLAPSAPATFPGQNGKIAFVRGLETIYTMRRDGSHERLVIRGAYEPDYSPSGRRILFVFNGSASQHTGLYTSRPDGTKLRPIPHTRYAQDGAFAPSGGKIVVLRYLEPYRHYLVSTKRVDGSHPRLIARDVFDPTFSPNGKWIAFDAPCNIGVMRANGRGQRLLTDLANTGAGCDSAPDFSPTGRKIVFSRDQRPRRKGIYTIWKDGTHLKRVYEATNEGISDPVFAPAGRRIAFSRRPASSREKQIYTIRPDGSGLRQLSRHDARHLQPSWGVRR